MPHCEVMYSVDLELDAQALLASVESCIQSHDAGSGACKGRAYPCSTYRHSHFLMKISVLNKPHRDKQFMAALLADLEEVAKGYISQTCYFTVSLDFSPENYATYEFTPD